MNKNFDEKLSKYVDNMLIGINSSPAKSVLRVRLMGILGTYFKQKKELETCKRKLKELGVQSETKFVWFV